LLIAASQYQAYQGNRSRQTMLFHAISLFMRHEGNQGKAASLSGGHDQWLPA
jgi:hypothetical protein